MAKYLYDAIDRRTQKVLFTPPSTANYVYDRLQCIEDRDGANTLQRQYVWGIELDNLLQEKTASATYFSHENAIGSICALTDGGGAVVERYYYDAFGKTTITFGGATGNEYRFHGARLDPETGMYWMRARQYHPSLGRFMQQDRIGHWTDFTNLGNGVAFVRNDAVDHRDPLGLECQIPQLAASTSRHDATTQIARNIQDCLNLQARLQADAEQLYRKIMYDRNQLGGQGAEFRTPGTPGTTSSAQARVGAPWISFLQIMLNHITMGDLKYAQQILNDFDRAQRIINQLRAMGGAVGYGSGDDPNETLTGNVEDRLSDFPGQPGHRPSSAPATGGTAGSGTGTSGGSGPGSSGGGSTGGSSGGSGGGTLGGSPPGAPAAPSSGPSAGPTVSPAPSPGSGAGSGSAKKKDDWLPPFGGWR